MNILSKLIFLLALSFMVFACNSIDEGAELTRPSYNTSSITSSNYTLSELNIDQENAFEALNNLQLQSNGHLFSTFPNIEHHFYPADSSFSL